MDPSPTTSTLDVRLDAPLPRSVAVGAGTAVFVCGSCFSPAGRIASLHLVVDGDEQPVMAHGMPRLDLFCALHPRLDPFETAGMSSDPDSEDDPLLHSYRSGFWGIAKLGPGRDDDREIRLRATLEGGARAEAMVASIATRQQPEPVEVEAPHPSDGPLVAISMATYEPPMELFRRQLESIRSQTHRNWVCVISDDCSDPERSAQMEAAVADDSRFVLSRSSQRLGFYHNFERALAMAPANADYVAMADQDDFWHPDKLESLLGALGDAQLVYSDARLVSRKGELLADTYWGHRLNNHSDIASLLMANSVTGAASLAPRRLLDYALPFPPAQFAHFHDHWIALTARSLGEIAYVDRPLYDYVQHGEAVLGHAAANLTTPLRARLAKPSWARTRVSASVAGGCTTSWTTVGWRSSRRSCCNAAAIAWRQTGDAFSSASPAATRPSRRWGSSRCARCASCPRSARRRSAPRWGFCSPTHGGA
jgi:hypothetical protein